MTSKRTLAGVICDATSPVWAPLEDLVGEEVCGYFMWMYAVELQDGARLHAYKHHMTRAYIHLAEDGRTFTYTATGRYREIDRCAAVVLAFEPYELLEPTLQEWRSLLEALRTAIRTPA